MRAPRLFHFDQNLKTLHGHYLGYATQIADAVRANGVEPVVVSHVEATIEATSFRVMPALHKDYWQQMIPPPGADIYRYLAESSGEFARTLIDVLDRDGAGPGDVVFLSYANLPVTMGVAKALQLSSDRLPRVVLLFRTEWPSQARFMGVGDTVVAVLYRQAFAEIAAPPGGSRTRLFADSSYLAEDYSELSRSRVQTVPLPIDPALAFGESPEIHRPPTVGYLGDARTSKGYHLLPAVAASLKERLSAGKLSLVVQSNFNVSGGERGIPEARAALAAMPGVTILPEPLAPDAYARCFHGLDLIVLPYRADVYARGTSGILVEAICAGVPAVVPAGTWMADELRRFGAGVSFTSWDAPAIAAAVDAALNDLVDLRARARSRRASYAALHTPAQLARFICGEAVMAAAAAAQHALSGGASPT